MSNYTIKAQVVSILSANLYKAVIFWLLNLERLPENTKFWNPNLNTLEICTETKLSEKSFFYG